MKIVIAFSDSSCFLCSEKEICEDSLCFLSYEDIHAFSVLRGKFGNIIPSKIHAVSLPSNHAH